MMRRFLFGLWLTVMLVGSAAFILGMQMPFWAAPGAVAGSFIISYALTRGNTVKEVSSMTLFAIIAVSVTNFLLTRFRLSTVDIGVSTLWFFIFGFTGNWYLTYFTEIKQRGSAKHKRSVQIEHNKVPFTEKRKR